MKPVRVQRKRNRGWKMPANTIYVGRPTKWGNPYRMGMRADIGHGLFTIETQEQLVEVFRHNRLGFILRQGARLVLKGKNLACWCPLDQACHADVLLELANE